MTFAPRFPRDVPRLTDGVVTLRAHRPDDVEALHEQAVDSVMLRWTAVPDPASPETARRYVAEVVPDGWRTDRAWAFAVEAPDGGNLRFVGTVSLLDQGEGRAEVVYGAHPWARGKGYVARALELLLDWGFRDRGLQTVVWWGEQGNWASRKVAWRLGFSCSGPVPGWLPREGRLADAWVGTLTATQPRRPRTAWLPTPRLAGDGVLLRRLGSRDTPRIVEACTDPLLTRWLTTVPTPYTDADAHSWLEETRETAATGRGVTWAVADPTDDRLLGVVTVFGIDPDANAEIGYWSHPEARGRGVMRRACALATRHAFVPHEDGGLGLRRLRALVADGNAASARVVEATGFRETGRWRRAKPMRDGTRVNLVHYDLLAEEYRPPVGGAAQ